MRQLTAYASYLDNLGTPLVGRARFFNMDGSEAVVYSLDNATQAYVQIGSSVFTNSSGQLVPQVFLDDHDYIVVFDKYIGAGTMAEDDDPESWAEQGSAVDRYNTLGVVLEGDSIRSVSTISELRSTRYVGEGSTEVVQLLGYNSPGDKPVVYYKWNPSNSDADDGGSVIKVTDVAVGRWVLVECPEYLDVRHFGAFPLQSSVENPIQRYAIQNAGLYAHYNDCGLYFTATDTAAYYDVSSLILHDVNCNPGAKLFSRTPAENESASASKATIHGIVNVHCGGTTHGQIELVDTVVRSSWEGDYGYAILSPTETLIIDSTLRTGNRTWTGIKVQMETYGGEYMVFDNCIITSNGAITDGITIKNCELHSDWFASGYTWSNLLSIGNKILLQNCDSADTYIKLKNLQSELDYGDLGEQVLNNASIAAGGIIENCSGTVTLQGDVEIHNATLTVNVASSPSDLNCIDCWLTFGSSTVKGLTVQRGAIYGTSLSAIGNVSLTDVNVDVPLSVLGGHLDLRNCEIDEAIDHVGNPVVENVVNCTFNAQLSIRGGSPGAVVTAVWTDNLGNVSEPISLDRTNLDSDDSAHDYIYKGNRGTFVMSNKVLCTVETGSYTEGTPNRLYQPVSTPASALVAYTTTESSSKYFAEVRFFSVGTSNVDVFRASRNRKCLRVTATPFLHIDSGTFYGSNIVELNDQDGEPGRLSSIVFKSGYTWRLRHFVLPGRYELPANTTVNLTFEQIQ